MRRRIRRRTRRILVGATPVGGDAPITTQSMTNTDTRDAAATSNQITDLARLGCDLVRVAVPDRRAVAALSEIVANSPIPVIADVHFDHRLALGAIDAGINGLRLNPGNIDNPKKVAEVAERAEMNNIPIRVGANAGSLPKGLVESHLERGLPKQQAVVESLVESALNQCHILEDKGFSAIKVSLKCSDVVICVEANRRFAERTDYPLHLGVTEAGTIRRGTVKSATALGALLLDGIGDTIRVSLTADPTEEVRVGKMILESVGARQPQLEVISCPTCGRAMVDVIGMAAKVEALIERLRNDGRRLAMGKIAVMGCVVNGPGEAADADLGLAGGNGRVTLFKFGETMGTYPEEEGLKRLEDEILAMIQLKKTGFE